MNLYKKNSQLYTQYYCLTLLHNVHVHLEVIQIPKFREKKTHSYQNSTNIYYTFIDSKKQ